VEKDVVGLDVNGVVVEADSCVEKDVVGLDVNGVVVEADS
jgi:hypothetical protein